MHTLIDVLKARGWTERDFNWNGDAAPYCRVGLSLLKQAAIFEVMPVWRRWLTPSSSPTVRSIFKDPFSAFTALSTTSTTAITCEHGGSTIKRRSRSAIGFALSASICRA